MKAITKYSLLVFFLLFGDNLFAQFYKSKYENVLIFQDEEILYRNFNYYPMSWGRNFHYINEEFIAITSPIDLISEGERALTLYENYQYKNTYSFLYSTKTKVLAHDKDFIYIPITKTDQSWNVLCKLNMKTGDITYIDLPENLRYLPFNSYALFDFSFDETTNLAYLFITSNDKVDENYVIPYNLSNGQFLNKRPLKIKRCFATLNSYIYYQDKSNHLYSIKIDDPKSKAKKINDKCYFNSVKISNTEIIVFRYTNDNSNIFEKNEYSVLKNGAFIIDKEDKYIDIYNTIRHKSEGQDFYFNYSKDSEYKNKLTLENYILYGNTVTIVKPGLFIIPIAAKGHKKGKKDGWEEVTEQKTIVQQTSSTTSGEEDYKNRLTSFLGSNESNYIFVTSNNTWYSVCVEYEKCKADHGVKAFLECKDLKDKLQSLGLDNKLNECEYLLNELTGSKKEYYKIEFGTESYENLKTELIKIKSRILRVK